MHLSSPTVIFSLFTIFTC